MSNNKINDLSKSSAKDENQNNKVKIQALVSIIGFILIMSLLIKIMFY